MHKENVIDIFETDKHNVCFVGDIHGDFNSLSYLMKRTGFTDTAFIVCGDCGFGFKKKEYYSQLFNKMSKTASKKNCEFIFVRGNHEDRSYFDKRLIHRKCFKTIPDYSVLKTPTHNILCIGGAISIDREYRKEIHNQDIVKYAWMHSCTVVEAEKLCPKVYWEDEPCYYDGEKLKQLKLNGIDVDIVATHTCPSFAKPFGKDNIKTWLERDEELEADLDNEREVMDKVYRMLKDDGHTLSKWFYGHFHFRNEEFIEGTEFIMLDMVRNGMCNMYMVNEYF